MSRTARLWKGAGLLTLGGALLSGAATRADDAPPLAEQLTGLGRQALAQGANDMARSFFQKALELDPASADATQGLEQANNAQADLFRVALQEPDAAPAPAEATPTQTPPAQPPAAAPPNTRATIEESERSEAVARQQLTSDIEQRLNEARQLVTNGQPEAALDVLRLAQNLVRSATNVPESARRQLDRRIQAQYLSTVRDEERIVAERLERQRLAAAAEQRGRGVDQFVANKNTISAMMSQFDTLMGEGVYNTLYNGGMGDILASTAPFYEARLLSQHARSLMHKGTLPYSDENPAPYAGMFVSTAMGFLSQERQFETLKEYRFMLTLLDVDRAMVPFPDDKVIEYPDAELWRRLSERRIARYGKAVDVFDRDPKTKQILAKLDEPLAMNFPNETPLEDVLNYIKQATQTPTDSGIPIYLDPIGLNEAEKTETSPVSIDLDGVPLKTTLRLLLRQLDLTYTVKDGFLMITSKASEDQQTEIRVYPVADLALIPISLISGGGMGGGMGMGGMGMMSIPVAPAQDDPANALLQKKSN